MDWGHRIKEFHWSWPRTSTVKKGGVGVCGTLLLNTSKRNNYRVVGRKKKKDCQLILGVVMSVDEFRM